jgi:type I restriction enzyme S subunit
MSEWKEYKIEELCSIRRGASPRPIHDYLSEEGMPWVKISDATSESSRFIKKTSQKILHSGVPKSLKVNPGDFILSNSATPGIPKFLNIEACIHDGWLLLSDFKNIDSLFLYYILLHERPNLANQGNGSVFTNLKTEIVKNHKIRIPDLQTQTAIAEILSSLDDKIELNNKINKELENLAQTFFKRWFIDFEFPNENSEPYKSSGGEMVQSELGEIPKGWEIKRLKQILTIKRGGSPRPIHDFMADSGLPWVKISDATALNSPFLFSTKEFIKVEGLRKTVLLKKGSLILSNSATPGLPKFLELDACIHDGWLHFEDIQKLTFNYLYLLFISIRLDLVGQGNGSIFINLKTDILKEYPITVPTTYVINEFINLIDPIFDKIKNVSSEIIQLTNLRDTLLPKLISGELEVLQTQPIS